MPPLRSSLYECTVLHHRFTPKEHRFLYRIFLFAFDLDELPELHRRLPLFSYNRANLFSFRDRDFLPAGEPLHHASPSPSATSTCNLLGYKPASPIGPPTASPSENRKSEVGNLKSKVLAYLAARGVDLDGGRVVLVTLPRVCGYLFNPVSFYYCYDASGACVASLAEVTNTFKEMKPYFLGPESRRQMSDVGCRTSAVRSQNPRPLTSDLSPQTSDLSPPTSDLFHSRVPKHFYVSPFSDVDVAFDFTLRVPGERLSVQIDDYVGDARTLTSVLAGPQRALTSARLAWFSLKYPLLTLRIIALIHWHAARLWLRRLPWFPKSDRPADQRDLYRPHSSIAHAAPTSLSDKISVPSEAA